MKKVLSARQRRFSAELLKDGNATKAAIRAGYSKKGASVQAHKLKSNPQIAKAIEARLQKIDEKAIVDKVYVLKNLKEVGERCMQHTPVMEFDHVNKEMVQKKVFDMETGKLVGLYEFDSSGANKALELLGKSMKMFTDKVEVDITDSLAERIKEARERINPKVAKRK